VPTNMKLRFNFNKEGSKNYKYGGYCLKDYFDFCIFASKFCLFAFVKAWHSMHCFVVHISSVNGQLLNIFGR